MSSQCNGLWNTERTFLRASGNCDGNNGHTSELARVVTELRDVQDALCDLLIGAGQLTKQQLLAQVHRRRFAAQQRLYPCLYDASLAQAFGINGPALAFTRFAGATCELHAVSRSLAESMTDARNATMAARPCKLYVCGGLDGQQCLSSVERFDPADNTWDQMPSMQQWRWDAVAAVIKGDLFICGG
eukprot:CAMPEP_0194524874 /NCGR_PEP_ID=MMETSP0253-20130528/60185_1 /TAXON_ID=2966 /ORGANISM="Noctiluca scintillans" /LENGTH=186 /DNA_ID=CAMNT_0039369545 /DNA_START=57 /DNA_END=614 /DNA_ORIENTATION=+